VVDVTSAWSEKLRVLDAYRSQFHREPGASPTTALDHPSFHTVLEARAVHYGAMIGVAFGEPYWQPGPVALRDLSDLFTPSSGYNVYS
jgi:hypothetical protein